TGTPIKNHEGSLIGMGGVMRDITERHHAIERIREQAEIIDHAPLGIITVALDNRIISCNRNVAALLGLGLDELIGSTAEDLFSEEVLESLIRGRRETMVKGQWSDEISLVTKNGRRVQVEFHMFLIRDADGNPRARLNVVLDITEKK